MFTAEVLVEGSEFPHLRATTTLVRDGSTNVLVDPGGKHDSELLLSSLRARRLCPEDIDVVVNTHMHYDHFENTDLFERARVLISRAEHEEYVRCVDALREAMGVARGTPGEPAWRAQVLAAVEEAVQARYEIINAFYLSRISQGLLRDLAFWTACEQRLEGRLVLLQGEHLLGSSARVVPTPGHTEGHVSVFVEDPPGGACVVVAGDAFPTVRWLGTHAGKMPLCSDVGEFLRTKDNLERAAHLVIPGHGQPFRVITSPERDGSPSR